MIRMLAPSQTQTTMLVPQGRGRRRKGPVGELNSGPDGLWYFFFYFFFFLLTNKPVLATLAGVTTTKTRFTKRSMTTFVGSPTYHHNAGTIADLDHDAGTTGNTNGTGDMAGPGEGDKRVQWGSPKAGQTVR